MFATTSGALIPVPECYLKLWLLLPLQIPSSKGGKVSYFLPFPNDRIKKEEEEEEEESRLLGSDFPPLANC